MSVELKPCPFCGRIVRMETFVRNEPFTMADFGYEIKCVECGVVFRESTPMLPELMEKMGSDRKYKEILMHRWNRRAET
jgi:C4-type Zn-finger protein